MIDYKRHPLSRRAFLGGVGACLSLPFLEQLAPAANEIKPPKRFGIFTVAGGTVIESWKPKEVGTLNKLPSILRPLEPFKNDLLILSGLSHHGRSEGNLNAHEHCSLMHLTGAPVVRKEDGKLMAGISVDQKLAQHLGDQTFLPSLEIGLAGHENRFSFRSADTPVPYEANPRVIFDRMFRGRNPVVPNWKTRSQTPLVTTETKKPTTERSVVDLVREEAKDLSRQLGKGDSRRLEEYLESVRAIEKRLDFIEYRQKLEAMDALNPGPSKIKIPSNLPKEGLPIWQITQPVMRDPERHEEYIRLMSDLMVLAFQTDSTRICTFACGSDEAMFPGVVTVGYERHCHTLEHQGNSARIEDADPIAREACRQIHYWYTQLFAEFVRKLKEIDEGGSSLFDNTLLLYTSYMADGGHGTEDYPVLLAGHLQKSIKTGRHIEYKKNTPVANLYVEILNQMGVKTDRFGESHLSVHRQYNGRLPGWGG